MDQDSYHPPRGIRAEAPLVLLERSACSSPRGCLKVKTVMVLRIQNGTIAAMLHLGV